MGDIRIHDISNTYVPFPQLFAKGKSLKSEGIAMPRDKNKGLHGAYRTNFFRHPALTSVKKGLHYGNWFKK
jgi:hypothetical protein